MQSPTLHFERQEFGAATLFEEAKEVIERFPHLFDSRIVRGVSRLLANSSSEFLSSRSHFQLKRILLAQFSQQMKMERAIASEPTKSLCLKLFRSPPSRICIAFAALSARGIQRAQVLKAFQGLLPSIQEVPGSFFMWQHPDQPYIFTYFEVKKLRGKDPSTAELRELERKLSSQLLSISPLTPAVFWPYNKEDSFRQIQLLLREIKAPNDIPQISVYFQEQTPSSLEFLIHLVRPAATPSLDESLRQLPNAFSFFSQFYRANKFPFPIELTAFSIKISANSFEVRDSINLLYARRYVLKQLEGIIGVFRDTNGGLFEVQQKHFEEIRTHLGDKIPYFELFAEKIFYALHPIETWLNLSLKDAESFFTAFSALFEDPSPYGMKVQKGAFAIIKTNDSQTHPTLSSFREKMSYAQISLGQFHYSCLIGSSSDQADLTVKTSSSLKTLRLVFQEGAPPSLNPHYASTDMRCRVLSKLLFEGLTRLDKDLQPELAGAERYTCSQDGLTYTFKLRSSSCWSNGERVTAADYVSSWQIGLTEAITHPEHLFILKGAKKYKETRLRLGVSALDASTLQVELENPDPQFLKKLAQPYFFPLFGGMREPKWFNGPYFMRDLNRNSALLEKNVYFWNAPSSFFEHIQFQWIRQDEEVLSLFSKGEIDWIGDPLTNLDRSQVHPCLEETTLFSQAVARKLFLYFNTQHPIFIHAEMRKAFGLIIDRAYICNTFFPQSLPAKAIQGTHEEARELFAQGLAKLNMKKEEFPELTFHFSLHMGRQKLAAFLKTTWESVLGISVRIEGQDWNHFRGRIEERDFCMCATIQDTIGEEDIDYFERFYGTNSWNFSQWTHAHYAELLAKAKKNPQSKNLEKLKELLQEEMPFTPLVQYTHSYAHSSGLEGYWIDEEGCVDFSRAFFPWNIS